MRSRIHRAWLAITPAVICFLVWATPLLAQDGGSKTTTSAFQMFFISDNILGMIITWLLIIMSVCTMALVLQHVQANRVSNIMPVETVGVYDDMLADKRFREAIEHAEVDESAFGQVMHASLTEAANGYGAMQRAIEESADLAGSKRIRSVEILNVLGAVGPMIGLFGTIYGMIVAFQVIVDKGGQPNPADLAAGISTALVTTFWGLVVGIPAVAAGALVRNKIDGTMVELMVQAETLIGQFAPGAAKRDAGAKPAPASSGGRKPSATPKPRPA
ncbi:MAG: MotA/TolQ/ExbB proton channel family protein [Phycisphaerae bacterium]|nr:MotA/TolQ/ExbB proton channel family protein [Phycisphaerae bacterium]